MGWVDCGRCDHCIDGMECFDRVWICECKTAPYAQVVAERDAYKRERDEEAALRERYWLDLETMKKENERLTRERDEADALAERMEVERDEARLDRDREEQIAHDAEADRDEARRERDEARRERDVFCYDSLSRARLAAEANNRALREALQAFVSAVSMQLARGEDTTPGDFERAWKQAHAALAQPADDTALREWTLKAMRAVRESDCSGDLTPLLEQLLSGLDTKKQ